MSDMKKLFWAIFIGMLIRLYTTFVAQNLWNWFAVDTFHASSISFFVMYGLLLLVDLIVEKPEHEEGYRWAMLSTAVDFCIPDDKREAVEQAMENLTNDRR